MPLPQQSICPKTIWGSAEAGLEIPQMPTDHGSHCFTLCYSTAGGPRLSRLVLDKIESVIQLTVTRRQIFLKMLAAAGETTN
jgi:hypothetical protein